MKNLLFVFIMGCFLSSCSSDSSSKPGSAVKTDPVFEKATAGTWVSDCMQGENGFVREIIKISSGKGTIQMLSFAEQTCEGQAQAGEITPFTYSVKSTKDGVSELTLSIKGKTVELKLQVEGDMMTTDLGNGPVRYNRAKNTGGGNPDNGGGNVEGNPAAMAAFDKVAMGVWITDQCLRIEGREDTALLVIEIKGNGSASQVINVFSSADCSGKGQPQAQEDLTYIIQEFANGQGRIFIQGQGSFTMRIQGFAMTFQAENGQTRTYRKIR